MFSDKELELIKDILNPEASEAEEILYNKVTLLLEMSEFKKDINIKRDEYNQKLSEVVERSNNVNKEENNN